ncbi:DUF4320 family protein [Bacillus thuringiensis]|nr:DUF4320 family protein [Bacillus thuringiensis]
MSRLDGQNKFLVERAVDPSFLLIYRKEKHIHATSSYICCFFLSLMFIIVFGVEFAGQTVVNVKANEISEYAVSLAERDGGFTPDVIDKVNQKLKDSNMDSKDWKMEYTQGKVQFNQPLTFTIKGSINIIRLNYLKEV